MKVDFSQVLKDLDGLPIKDDSKKEGDLTLGAVARNALALLAPRDEVTGEEKLARFLLAVRIVQATEPIEITPEEATKIRQLVGRLFFPVIVGRVFDLIK